MGITQKKGGLAATALLHSRSTCVISTAKDKESLQNKGVNPLVSERFACERVATKSAPAYERASERPQPLPLMA